MIETIWYQITVYVPFYNGGTTTMKMRFPSWQTACDYLKENDHACDREGHVGYLSETDTFMVTQRVDMHEIFSLHQQRMLSSDTAANTNMPFSAHIAALNLHQTMDAKTNGDAIKHFEKHLQMAYNAGRKASRKRYVDALAALRAIDEQEAS